MDKSFHLESETYGFRAGIGLAIVSLSIFDVVVVFGRVKVV